VSGSNSADSHVSPRVVECFFDYSSPWAYLGTTQIERVAAEAGARVVWKPFLLGALFKAIGTPLVPIATMPEVKRRHVMIDLGRWASHWQVPFRFTSRFPIRTVTALRLTLLAPEDRRAALVHRLMRACWVDDADAEDPETLRAAAADAGVDPELVAACSTPPAKEALHAATAEAEARLVPGAPTFLVGEHLFWGQDRLDFVKKALMGWHPAADASMKD
jgi:2-hydroxychromene-2-carboxylate isomerase